MYSASPKAKRLEFRPPDPSCNTYLAFSAMLMAGLDGIKNKIDPGQPLDKDILRTLARRTEARSVDARLARRSARRPRERSQVPTQGRRFHRGTHRPLDQLQEESAKSDPVRMRPHPYEFQLYYDI